MKPASPRPSEARAEGEAVSLEELAPRIAQQFIDLLTLVKGNAEMLMLDLTPQHPFRTELQEIGRAADRASLLSQNLLTIGGEHTPRTLDLNAVIADAGPRLQQVLGGGISLVVVPDAFLAPVLADRAQIEMVLLNLAANARDAMPEGGILSIQTANAGPDGCTSGEPRDFVRIDVRDTGCGMDDETVARAFEPFFTTRGDRAGLGLTMVRSIIEQAGGWLRLASLVGVGTTVHLHLPRRA
jgi:two-component system, cell cycle sensor histidine kinase and response regulator CckA